MLSDQALTSRCGRRTFHSPEIAVWAILAVYTPTQFTHLLWTASRSLQLHRSQNVLSNVLSDSYRFVHFPKQLHAVPYPRFRTRQSLWPMPGHRCGPCNPLWQILVTPSMQTADFTEPQGTTPLTSTLHVIPASTAALRVHTGTMTGGGRAFSPLRELL